MITNYDLLYFDRRWLLYDSIKNILDHPRITRFINAIYSGLLDLARHFNKVGEFMIIPKGVTIENKWTATGTGTSISVPVNLTAVGNAYVIVSVAGYTNSASTYGFTSPALNGVGMTTHASQSAANYSRTLIAGIIPATTGSMNFTCSISTSITWYCTVYLVSGVSQSSPIVAAGTVTGGANPSIVLNSTAMGMSFDCVSNNATGYSPSAGQTVDNGAGGQTLESHLATTTNTITLSYTGTSAYTALSGVTLNPG